MTMTSLLPPNSTPVERTIEAATVRVGAVPVPVDLMWRPESCPAAFLPWLAWSLSVDEWDDGWTEETKRQVIAASIAIHRRKGTIWAMRRALVAAGMGDAELIENYGIKTYNGTVPRNGTVNRERPDHWAEYRVILKRRISLPQAAVARRILEEAAPARCRLKVLDYRRALSLYGDRLPRNATFSRGAA